jgi:hypothetical protein
MLARLVRRIQPTGWGNKQGDFKAEADKNCLFNIKQAYSAPASPVALIDELIGC